ncbi:MAG: ribonuclease HII [Actinomycetota bacterium]|nr:ribonuclease HII [Actinomycetota bacterium]
MADSAALYAFDAAWVLEREAPLAGADEAGRGALAGPLVASAVILDPEAIEIEGLNDSKAVRPVFREGLYGEVLRHAAALAVVSLPAWWIDRWGVGTANKEALKRAIGSLETWAGCGLADGNLRLGPEIECLPRADGRSAAVAAASVVAKVLRDHAMHHVSGEHGGYGFERNRGYGTREHQSALAEIGPCRVHRLSYAGVGP